VSFTHYPLFRAESRILTEKESEAAHSARLQELEARRGLQPAGELYALDTVGVPRKEEIIRLLTEAGVDLMLAEVFPLRCDQVGRIATLKACGLASTTKQSLYPPFISKNTSVLGRRHDDRERVRFSGHR